MSTIAMAITGVLRAEIGGGTLAYGARLFRSFLDNGYIVELLSDSLDLTFDNHWLAVNGFTGFGHVFPSSVVDETIVDTRLRQVRGIKADLQADLQFLVEQDLRVIEKAFANGIPCLAVMVPKYQRPEFRPDFTTGPKPWDDVKAEVDKERLLKASDTRILEPQ